MFATHPRDRDRCLARSSAAWIVGSLLAVSMLGAGNPSTADIEFFESKIRPVLVKHCYECHSADAKSLKAGLRLDSPAGMREGGESGPVVVPGKVDESTLIAALRYESTKMPPSGKLPDDVIADFTKWVAGGAPDPRTATTVQKKGIDLAAARQFWSFRPLATTPPPKVRDESWIKTPIDRFILSALEAKGLAPVPPAGKRELIRRATFDLIGLPPTPEEIDAFLADTSPEAFDRVVERLLASPHYGERWGRSWLDVARYAEDQAHTFATEPNTSAYRYRDWVVRAFNNDLPYDRFIKLQIAGDQLEEGSKPPYDGRVALGFFGLGAQYYKNTDAAKAAADELDDRVDTMTRGFLGLTVSCARCHDHKFDPIPTQDYYSLAGVFSSSKLANLPLVADEEVKRFQERKERLKTVEGQLNTLTIDERAKLTRATAERLDAYLVAAWKLKALQREGSKLSVAEVAARESVDPELLDRSAKWLDSKNDGPQTVAALADPWKTLTAIPEAKTEGAQPPKTVVDAARKLRDEIRMLTSRQLVNRNEPSVEIDLDIDGANRLWLVVGDAGDGQSCDWADWIEPKLIGPAGEKKLTEIPWKKATSGFGQVNIGKNAGGSSLRVGGREYADGIGTHAPSVIVYDLPPGYTRFKARGGIDNGGADQGGSGATVQFVATTKKPESTTGAFEFAGALDAPKAELLTRLFGKDGVFNISDDTLSRSLSPEKAKQFAEIKAEAGELRTTTAQGPPIAHSIAEATPADMHVFIRGNPAQQGDLAPRRFIKVIAGDSPTPFVKGSGRLELADAVASPDNPLTARVMVNRIWQNHFGRGIVGTGSNFGATGERPSHPELLDYLARRFIEVGWSIKTIHREIMHSSTYQLSTDYNEHNFQIDGDNRYLWRANRRRLDVEAWRDAFLAVSGRLDPTVGGQSTDLASPTNTRRTLYAMVSRHKLDALLRLFDFPDPNITSDKRSQTTVPQQQLFVLNSPFVVEQAKALAARLQSEPDDTSRIRRAYLLAYGRPAEDAEVTVGLAYLSSPDDPGETPVGLSRWERYAQVLLSGNEFLYLD